MIKRDILKQVGFSDAFLAKLEEYESNVTEVAFSGIKKNQPYIVYDSNSVVIEKGNQDMSSKMTLYVD